VRPWILILSLVFLSPEKFITCICWIHHIKVFCVFYLVSYALKLNNPIFGVNFIALGFWSGRWKLKMTDWPFCLSIKLDY
jgi:hypothetical protein